MIRVFTPDLSDNRRVGLGDFKAREGVFSSLFVGKRGDVSKFGKKEIGTGGFGDNLTKNNVGYALHWGETEKRFR